MHYYLGPWIWRTSPRPSWGPPSGCLSSVDLRPLPVQALAGGTPQGCGFFALGDRLTDESGYDYLGNDMGRTLSMAQRRAWKLRLGLRAVPERDILKDVFYETLTQLADPTGDDVCPPLLPGEGGVMELRVAGVHSRPRPGNRKWRPVQDCLRREYRKVRERALSGRSSPDLHRKYLATLVRKFNLPDDARHLFIPKGLPDEGLLTPSTTFTESFNQADSTTLGPDLTWTEAEDDLETVSNECTHVNGAFVAAARAEHDVSTDDHFCELDITQLVDASPTTTNTGGPTCRFVSAALTYYLCALEQPGTPRTTLYRRSAGTYTVLGNSVNVTLSLPDTMKVQADGSTIKGFFNNTENHSQTDTAITGNLRGGLELFGGTGRDVRADNFEITDIVAGITHKAFRDRGTVLIPSIRI